MTVTANLQVAPGGKLTIKQGDYKESSNYNVNCLGNVLIEENATFNNSHNSSVVKVGWYGSKSNDLGLNHDDYTEVQNNPTGIINGGTFGEQSDITMNAVKVDDYGIVTINGGTFYNTILNYNVLTINDGTFDTSHLSSTSASIIANSYINDTSDKGELVINGGTFIRGDAGYIIGIGTDSNVKEGGSITINGGTFNGNMIKWGNSIVSSAITVNEGYFTDTIPDEYLGEECIQEQIEIDGTTYNYVHSA